jgi:1-deoxy-D-xylulose-5-phosphate reductoisomerase
VRYVDGSLLAQLGEPDMRTPIAYGLGWPHRIDSGVKKLNMMTLKDLHFMVADAKRYPAILLAREAARAKGTAPAILNAANEVAVESFLQDRIKYTQIIPIVNQVLQEVVAQKATSLELVLEADQQARAKANMIIKGLTR